VNPFDESDLRYWQEMRDAGRGALLGGYDLYDLYGDEPDDDEALEGE
jgi:hypothetical protein